MITVTDKFIIRSLLWICTCYLLSSSTAHAQFSISEHTYKKLQKVEKLIDQKNYKDALSVLDELQKSSVNKKYELSLVYQARGHIYYETNRIPQAIDMFEKSLFLHTSPLPVTQNIRLNLIQGYVSANNYSKAINQFTLWLGKESSPSPDVLALGGSLYAYVKQYDKAIQFLKQAISTSKKAEESWYRTLLSVYFDKEDYTSANGLLQKLISRQPDNKQYWTQLFSGYYLLKDYKSALSVLELAYTRQLLTSEEDITNLVKLYLYLGIPTKAIPVLQNEMQNNHIAKNKDNLQLLANSYIQSREWRKAAEIYLQLADINHNTTMTIKSAQLFMQARQWQSAIDALTHTKRDGENGQVSLLTGRALMELHEPSKAQQAFAKAKLYPDSRIQAEQWLRYLRSQTQNP